MSELARSLLVVGSSLNKDSKYLFTDAVWALGMKPREEEDDMLTRKLIIGGLLLPVALAACGGEDTEAARTGSNRGALTATPQDDKAQRWYGQTEFESFVKSWGWDTRSTLESAAAGNGGERSIEEADLYRHDETRGLLYVLNTYRGLQVIDAKDPDNVSLIGRADLGGIPVEMYQRGNQAYVILNSFTQPTGEDTTETGAMLAVYDLSNPAAPLRTAEFAIAGQVEDSRLLATEDGSSQVIYVMSKRWQYLQVDGQWESASSSYVMSIDVTDPTAPAEIERVEFDGAGRHGHVTTDAIFVSSYDWSHRPVHRTVRRHLRPRRRHRGA